MLINYINMIDNNIDIDKEMINIIWIMFIFFINNSFILVFTEVVEK